MAFDCFFLGGSRVLRFRNGRARSARLYCSIGRSSAILSAKRKTFHEVSPALEGVALYLHESGLATDESDVSLVVTC